LRRACASVRAKVTDHSANGLKPTQSLLIWLLIALPGQVVLAWSWGAVVRCRPVATAHRSRVLAISTVSRAAEPVTMAAMPNPNDCAESRQQPADDP
jgi:hypothetical protein